jgi:ATP sulfurylase
LEGLRPPAVVMRPEVHDVVVRWRMWGHPFVTWCYPK